MSPRNEFKAGDEGEPWVIDPDMELVVLRDEDGLPYFAQVSKTPAGKPEDEVSDLEVDPIEDDPHNWPAIGEVSLAELRKSHQSITEAHRETGHI